MYHGLCTILFTAAALTLAAGPTQAGPCTKDLAQFEQAIKATSSDAGVGPSGPQSIGAQMEHQPTPESVAAAQRRADAGFDAVLAQAKSLDAEGNAACHNALTRAKLIYFQ